MTRDEKIYLCDLNLAEYRREVTRWRSVGEIREEHDLLLTLGPSTFPSTNVAMYLGGHDRSSAALLFDRIRSFYAKHNASFSIQMRQHADSPLDDVCRREKMIPAINAPCLVIDHPLSAPEAPPDVELRHITTAAGVRDFAFVITQSYVSLGMPAYVGNYLFGEPARLLQPCTRLLVAYEDGRPVSAAMILFYCNIAGLYWVGTLEAKRGQRFSKACVMEMTNEAFRLGAVLVTLQASTFGEPLYLRLGFEEITRYLWYMTFIKAPARRES